jgi:phosphatidylglycerol:prolipoprotein diacylglycerol transferase
VITAHPLSFTIFRFPITGFGIMMMLAFLMAGWLIDRELRRQGFAPDYAGDIVVAAVIGGIIGAKLWFVALWGPSALLARGGLVWYGGFIGGTLAVIINGWRRGVPIAWTAHLAACVLPAAYAIGRVGCYVVGDDYGIPTALPWGVRFPEGLPPTTAANLRAFHVLVPDTTAAQTVLAVHPTQLYEIALMLGVFALIWRWRTMRWGTGWLFGAYLVLGGAERFLIEFLRAKDDRAAPGALSKAQITSLLLIAVGAVVITTLRRRGRTPPGLWLVAGSAGAPTRPAPLDSIGNRP